MFAHDLDRMTDRLTSVASYRLALDLVESLLAKPDQHRGVTSHRELVLLAADGGVSLFAPCGQLGPTAALDRVARDTHDRRDFGHGAVDSGELADLLFVDRRRWTSH